MYVAYKDMAYWQNDASTARGICVSAFSNRQHRSRPRAKKRVRSFQLPPCSGISSDPSVPFTTHPSSAVMPPATPFPSTGEFLLFRYPAPYDSSL
jgi:hypothetical protein